jgi:glycosyltransferase involved in cell wall biosynthesis
MALLKYFDQIKNDLPVRLRIDICLTGGVGEFDEEARALGAKLFYLPYSRKSLHRFIPAFRRILSKGRYHAIHDHQDYVAGMHFLFGLGHLPPIRIVHVHNPSVNIAFFSSSLVRRSVLLTGKHLLRYFATHILGTSRQIITEYGFDDRFFRNVPLRAAHCGFEVTRYQGRYQQLHSDLCKEFGWKETAKIILFVGRLDSNCNQKNPAFALDVGKVCIAKDPDIHMIVAGGGDEVRKELEAKTKSWALENRIRLIGIRSDVPRLMSGSDVLLFPSVAEGLGMVAVEAQAAGLRVLASDATPRECVVVPGMVEFLSLKESAAHWADAALRLINLPRPDSEECNETVRDSPFSIENSAATLLSIYQIPVSSELNYSKALQVGLAGN